MIGYIKGKIINTSTNQIVIYTASGVGYRLQMTGHTYLGGEEVEVFVHTAMSQDSLTLWGFAAENELKLFEQLISVSGVGLKTAQLLLAQLGVVSIVQAILANNSVALKVPGVGGKTSEKIIIELRNKVSDSEYLQGVSEKKNDASESAQIGHTSVMRNEVSAALNALGYTPAQINQALLKVDWQAAQTTESLLKQLLRQI